MFRRSSCNPAFGLFYLEVLPSLYQEYHWNCTPSYEFLLQWYFLPSLFIPRLPCYCNRNADKWIVMCEINTPSNSLLGSKWTIFSFLACWLLNYHSKIDLATYSIFPSALFDQWVRIVSIPRSLDHIVLPWKARLFSSLITYRWFVMFRISSRKYYQVVPWSLCWVRDHVGFSINHPFSKNLCWIPWASWLSWTTTWRVGRWQLVRFSSFKGISCMCVEERWYLHQLILVTSCWTYCLAKTLIWVWAIPKSKQNQRCS